MVHFSHFVFKGQECFMHSVSKLLCTHNITRWNSCNVMCSDTLIMLYKSWITAIFRKYHHWCILGDVVFSSLMQKTPLAECFSLLVCPSAPSCRIPARFTSALFTVFCSITGTRNRKITAMLDPLQDGPHRLKWGPSCFRHLTGQNSRWCRNIFSIIFDRIRDGCSVRNLRRRCEPSLRCWGFFKTWF